MADDYYPEPDLAGILLQRNALDREPSWQSPLSSLGSSQPRQPWEWTKDHPELAAFLSKVPLAFGALPGRAPLAMLRRQDLALRPLTAAELEMAALYKRILNPEPLGAPKPPERAPGSADPPSFYDMWKGQGK